jgi:hypothetical protein
MDIELIIEQNDIIIEIQQAPASETGGAGTPEEIRDALETLTGVDRLDASAIRNLPNSAVWGGITGDIADQTDLGDLAVKDKVDYNNDIDNLPNIPTKTTYADINTGTNDDKYATSLSLASSKYNTEFIPYALGSQDSGTTSGTKITDYFAYAFSMTSVKCTLRTAATGGTLFTIDIKKNGTSIFSTKITFDASEVTIATALTPYVLVNTPTTFAVNDKLEIIIDSVGSSVAGIGPIIYLIGSKI